MKRYKLLLGLSLCALTTIRAEKKNDINDSFRTEASSKSYLNFQPVFQTGSPELIAGFRGLMRQTDRWGAIQIVGFGGRTTKSKELARYFSPVEIMKDQSKIVFGSDVGVQEFDVLADHFNVFTVNGVRGGGFTPDAANQFLSNVTIAPQQTVVGGGFQWRYPFWVNEDKGHGWWLSLSLPVVHVKNNMHFKEEIINDGGGVATTGLPEGKVVFGSLEEAFMQKAWKYGKIKTDCDNLSKTGVAEVDLRLGYEWLEFDPCHLESFIGVIIPTSNRPKSEFLFEPIVGNGGHFGIEWGATYSMNVWDNPDRDMIVTMEHSVVNKFLFKRKQVRSLDLKNKPWSRYIELYASQADALAAQAAGDAYSATPGINILTQEVSVTPGYQFQMNNAFIFGWKRFNFEGGFNFLARRSEQVKLSNEWKESAAIKAFGGVGRTSPIRDITGDPYIELAITNPEFVPPVTLVLPVLPENYAQSLIKESDLDLVSAVSPASLAYGFYANFAYVFDVREYPFLIDAGASYTFGHQNNVIDRWLVWGKLGIAF